MQNTNYFVGLPDAKNKSKNGGDNNNETEINTSKTQKNKKNNLGDAEIIDFAKLLKQKDEKDLKFHSALNEALDF